MEMYGGPVLGVIFLHSRHPGHIQGTHSCPHDGGVHWQEEIAASARGKQVAELDAHRPIAICDDQRPQIMGIIYSRAGLPSAFKI
jgi:hypothetical protein